MDASTATPADSGRSKAVRLLSVDFGERHVGVALSDDTTGVAVPLATLRRTSDRQLLASLVAIGRREEVDEVVVGDPCRLDGTPGPTAPRVRAFGGALARALGVPCTLVPETLTSVEARRRLRDAGVDLRRHPERVDAVAAQIILEELLAERGRRA